MKIINIISHAIIFLTLSIYCSKPTSPKTESITISISYPENNTTINAIGNESIIVQIKMSDTLSISSMTFYVDHDSMGHSSNPPYQFTWCIALLADNDTHTIFIEATDFKNQLTRSDPVNVIITNSYNDHEMIYVTEGEFTMGSDHGNLNEQPVHTVFLDSYWISKYEITNIQYTSFLNEIHTKGQIQITGGKVTQNGNILIDFENKGQYIFNNDDCLITFDGNDFFVEDIKYHQYPVISVTWYGGQAYCRHYGMNLPTEAQWEKAARGTDGRKYPWGNTEPTHMKSNYNHYILHPIEIGLYSPQGDSPYGCCNMAGNVSEWCQDWYDEDQYLIHRTTNPEGPDTGTKKVIRGGNWENNASFLRCSDRNYKVPKNYTNHLGFRCKK